MFIKMEISQLNKITASNTDKPIKTYVKKLDNGFGIKAVTTSAESVLILTTEPAMSSNTYRLDPYRSHTTTDSTKGSIRPNLLINTMLNLEPHFRKLYPGIVGFHIFEDDNSLLARNVEKTSIIFVANTELAKEKGVHFNIPGKLMNVHYADVKDKPDKIKFYADPIVKPLTIIVGEYVLHIYISFESPLNNLTKHRTSTQTRKRSASTCSIPNTTNRDYINSSSTNSKSLQIEHKEIQTDRSILIHESTQTHCRECIDKCVTQIDSADVCNCDTSTTGLHINHGKSFLNLNCESETAVSLAMSKSDCLSAYHDSGTSIKTFLSHTQLQNLHGSVNTLPRNDQVSTCTSGHWQSETLTRATNSHIHEHNTKYIKNIKSSENNLTLLDSFSKYDCKPSIIDDDINNDVPSNHNISVQNGHKSTLCKNISKESLHKIKENVIFDVKNKDTKNPNISIKEIKQHLNEATFSLHQLYSIVEFIEDLTSKTLQERSENILSEIVDNSFSCKSTQSVSEKNNLEIVAVDAPSTNILCEYCGLFCPISATEDHVCCVYDASMQTDMDDGKECICSNTSNKSPKSLGSFQYLQREHSCKSSKNENLLDSFIKSSCNDNADCYDNQQFEKFYNGSDSRIFYNKNYKPVANTQHENYKLMNGNSDICNLDSIFQHKLDNVEEEKVSISNSSKLIKITKGNVPSHHHVQTNPYIYISNIGNKTIREIEKSNEETFGIKKRDQLPSPRRNDSWQTSTISLCIEGSSKSTQKKRSLLYLIGKEIKSWISLKINCFNKSKTMRQTINKTQHHSLPKIRKLSLMTSESSLSDSLTNISSQTLPITSSEYTENTEKLRPAKSTNASCKPDRCNLSESVTDVIRLFNNRSQFQSCLTPSNTTLQITSSPYALQKR